MRTAEAATVGAVLAAFVAAEWAVWLSRRPSDAPLRPLVTWAYLDDAAAAAAAAAGGPAPEDAYDVRWNETGFEWAGDAVWRIHRTHDTGNGPPQPCPLSVIRDRPRLTAVNAMDGRTLRLEYSDAVVVDAARGGSHGTGDPGQMTLWDDARAWLAANPPPWIGDDVHCGDSWAVLVDAVGPPRTLPALDTAANVGASGLEVWTTCSPDAVWSGSLATDAWPLSSARRLSVAAVTGDGWKRRTVDVGLDADAVASCGCMQSATGVASHSVWVRHPSLSTSSSSGSLAWRDAWPPHGAVVDGRAPLVTDMRCDSARAGAREGDGGGGGRSGGVPGGGGAASGGSNSQSAESAPQSAAITARERWTPAVVHIENGPFDPSLADIAPHRASVHLYADRALQLWRASLVSAAGNRMRDPTVLAVDRVSWWRSSRADSVAERPVARAVVELVWWEEKVPASPHVWHRALVDVVDSQIDRLDARIRSSTGGGATGDGGRDAMPLLAVVLRHGVTDGPCPAAAAQAVPSPGCDIDLSTDVSPAKALLACLDAAASAQPVVVWAGACAAVAIRADDRTHFVVEHALAYIPLLPRPLQRSDPPCREPLEGADAERCCADEPDWLHGWLPAVVLAVGDLHRLASSTPPGAAWSMDSIATALRTSGIEVLRVPHPTIASVDMDAADFPDDDVAAAPPQGAPRATPVLSATIAGGARATSTMSSTGGHAPAHAVDQDPYTFFWSEGRLAVNDTLEVVWPAPMALASLEVYTGSWRYPTHWLRDGVVEVAASVDPDSVGPAGIVWSRLTDLTLYHNGVHRAWFASARQVQALRIRATEPQDGLAVEDVYVSVVDPVHNV